MSKQNPKISGYDTSGQCIIAEELYRDSFEVDTVNLNLRRGFKNYEVTNHVGNVMAVISDHRNVERNPSDTNTIKYYKPQFLDFNYLYPYGSIMPGNYTDSGYAFGFNTQLKVDEISGKSKHYTAEFWEYNPRIVKRWNLDPKSHPSFSPYDINRGNPVWFSDSKGDSIDLGNLYEKDSDGKFKFQRQIKAFELFASTKEGQEWVESRAHQGFELKGAFDSKLHIIANKEGALSKKGVNAKFNIMNLKEHPKIKNSNFSVRTTGASGLTDVVGEESKSLSIIYHIDIKSASDVSPLSLLNTVETITHETMFHGDYKEQFFLQGKPINNRDAYHPEDILKKSKYFSSAPRIMKVVSDKVGLDYSSNYLWYNIMMPGFGYNPKKEIKK